MLRAATGWLYFLRIVYDHDIFLSIALLRDDGVFIQLGR
jgi:hypothetical protein